MLRLNLTSPITVLIVFPYPDLSILLAVTLEHSCALTISVLGSL
jgi:hypothetical protein